MGDRPGHIGTTDVGGGGDSLVIGQRLLDRNGNQWEVVQIGGGVTAPRLGLRSLSGIQSPSPDGAFSLFGAIRTGAGDDIFLTESGSAIRLSPDGTFAKFGRGESSDLFPDVGGGGVGGGTSGSAPSFASTQAAQTQGETFARQQAETLAAANLASEQASREFQTEQNRLAEEAALKRNRLSTLTDLIQSFVASQAQARDTLANLQPDPFRFAAVAGGVTPFGTTPQQGFTQQLQDFASAPVPTADPNASLPSIESAIQGLTGANVPLPPQVFGAAGGATIPAPAPGQSVNVKVGERGEEILRVTAQGVEVIPLAGGFAHGGTIDFPFEPIPFDRESLFPALTTSGIFGATSASSQLRGLPFSAPGPRGGFGAGTGGAPFTGRGLNILEGFGIRPSLIRFAPRGSTEEEVARQGVFFRDPTTGQLQGVRDQEFRDAGFNVEDVTLVDPSQRSQFEFGPRFTGRPDPSLDQPSPFTRFSQPIVEPTTGVLLPAPFIVARQLNTLRLTNPAAFNLLLSAYRSAGVPVEAVLGSVQASLPFGQARTNIGLN